MAKGISLEQKLKQTQTQKLTHQQLQLLKLLEVPTLELEDKIKQEIEENPALEEYQDGTSDKIDETTDNDEGDEYENNGDDTRDDYDFENDDDYWSSDFANIDENAEDYLISRSSYDDSLPTDGSQYSTSATMLEDLTEQLSMKKDVDERIYKYALYVLGNLDNYGLLGRTIEQLADDFSFSSGEEVKDEDMEAAVDIVQTLEPAGVGARDLRECLLLQLRRIPEKTKEVQLATYIIDNCFDDVLTRRFDKITQKLNVSIDETREAFAVIASLNPRPYVENDVLAEHSMQVVPDFDVHAEDGQLELTMLNGRIPELGISRTYREMINIYAKGNKKTLTKSQKDAAMFAKQKVESAEWFIRAIKQRANTLYEVVSKIVMYQRKYFLTGDKSQLRPMTLKDIAALSKYEVSTISRVTNSKYIQTDFGIFALKDLFTSSLVNDDDDDVSAAYIKELIEKAVNEEDKRKPLTDEQIAAMMSDKGINLARRTVAKYRDQLGIPSTRQRRVVI